MRLEAVDSTTFGYDRHQFSAASKVASEDLAASQMPKEELGSASRKVRGRRATAAGGRLRRDMVQFATVSSVASSVLQRQTCVGRADRRASVMTEPSFQEPMEGQPL